MTECYECGREIRTTDTARMRVLPGEAVAILLCVSCRPNHPSHHMYTPSRLPERSRVPITVGGEQA